MNLILSLVLGLAVTNANATTAAKAVKKVSPVVKKTATADIKKNEVVNPELIKFNKENARLTIAHLEMMRAKNIKNVNFQFDTMIANQKEIQKASDSALNGGKVLTRDDFEILNSGLKKKHELAQEKFMETNKAEDDKFKAMMDKRQDVFNSRGRN